MSKKAGMSEVKFKVRHNALYLREFTVADMVRATGLKPESVRTEVQRMRGEKMLTSEPLKEKRLGRGGRPALYKLVRDPEKRLALSHEVESFFPEPRQAFPLRPSSRHYLVATRLLDRIVEGYYKTDREMNTALEEAEEHLKFAEYEEGKSEALISAYIDRERARVEYLRCENETAEALFHQARQAFKAAELDHEVTRVDEYLACIQTYRRYFQQGAVNPAEKARCTLEVLETMDKPSDRPLMNLLIHLLHELSSSMRKKALDVAWEPFAHLQVEKVEVRRAGIHLGPLQRSLYSGLEKRLEPWEQTEREQEDWTELLAKKT